MSVVQVHESDGAPRYFNVESLLSDYSKFKKWNTNWGGVNLDEPLLQAFSHWTYDITGENSLEMARQLVGKHVGQI